MERDGGQAGQDVRAAQRVDVLATASVAAYLAAACGLLYSVSFVIVTRLSSSLGIGLSSIFLMLGGLLGTAALVGLYERLRGEVGTYLL